MGERGRKEPSTSTSGVRLENSFDFKKGTVDVELVLCPAAFLSRGQPPMLLPPRMRWAARAALLSAIPGFIMLMLSFAPLLFAPSLELRVSYAAVWVLVFAWTGWRYLLDVNQRGLLTNRLISLWGRSAGH